MSVRSVLALLLLISSCFSWAGSSRPLIAFLEKSLRRTAFVGQTGATQAGLLIPSIVFMALVRQSVDGTPTDDTKSPSTNRSDIETGRMYVRGYCSRCHGLDAKGGRAPDLTQSVLRHGNTDQALSRNIRNGIPGTGMAGFYWPEKRIQQVVSFLQDQRRTQRPSVLPGDARKGEETFKEYQCAACHWTGRDGGRRGPDLSASRGSLEYVRRALIDPAADVDPQYQLATLVTEQGRVLQGLRLSENSFYVQLIDQNDRLHTIPKENVEALHRPNQSLMPSYEKQLGPTELDDLIAYVFSLRKD